MSKIVIIGNGIAGITAARHIRKNSDHEITVISSESKYFFSRTALMYIYMGHMKFEHTQPYENWFWRKNEIELIQERVAKISSENKSLQLSSGDTIPYDKLILALGSKPNPMPMEGANLKGVQSLYSKQDLELMEQNSPEVKQAVVVGGGLIGIEMAEMLHSRGVHVTLVVREDSYWNMVLPKDESKLVNEHILSRGIDLKLANSIIEIKGSPRVEQVVLKDQTTLDCQFLGITIGVSPNIKLIEGTEIDINRGILVDEYLKTSVDNIYAIGDCAELRNPPAGRLPIEAVWYVGRLMGETIATTICEDPEKYNPGIWFNSAKFLDLEYQTYGLVPANQDDNYDSFFWQDPNQQRSIRLVYDKSSTIVGIVGMGIRIKHEVCEEWIKTGKNLDFAMANLPKLDFDPEFYNRFTSSMNKANLV